jgi:hypothetical protein
MYDINFITLILIISVILIAIIIVGFGRAAAKAAAEKEVKRQAEIVSHRDLWGDAICALIIKKSISVDMTQEMVLLSWGLPRSKDQHEITKSGTKIRWVYGIPRQNARYIWFKGNVVVKIKS